MSVAPRGKAIWVVCPNCEFAFYCGPEYLDPSRGYNPIPEADIDQYLRCPKCKKTFKVHESKTPIGTVPPRLVRRYLRPEFTLDEVP